MLALAYFALSPQARATCQEGCLTNGNTVLGDDALLNNTGINNTAIGSQALFGNTIGDFNTANGDSALFSNTTGFANTANGFEALYSNTTGGDNTANGDSALFSNTTGSANTANGFEALSVNTTGNDNTATGMFALNRNATGNANTANGVQALFKNKTGRDNTADGVQALGRNTIGNGNIALGFTAGLNLTTGSNNIDIGNGGVAGESNAIRMGTIGTHIATYIAGISGATVPAGVPVIIDTTGHLGTTTSSARFKESVQPMDKASDALLALKPVTFRYKKDLDPESIPQFGLVAEEVEKVNPDLVVHDEQGKPYTVRYEAVNAMLLNEFLKEHRKVQELEANAARQQKQIDALTAGLQKVSAQLEASKAEQQIVANSH